MCGRYLRRSDKQRLAEAFRLVTSFADIVLPPWDYNVAPTSTQPVIRHNRDTAERELVLMRWGLVPNFTRSLADVKSISTINARAESLLTSSTWRLPFHRHRCLIPADGFYEWKLLPPALPKAKPNRKPYAFTLASGAPLAFAGLWDAWRDPANDTWLQTFSIITTTPNELTAEVHTRMPVILHPRDYDRWLARPAPGKSTGERREDARPPLDLLRPFPADEMQRNEAHLDVGNVRNNHPGLLLDGALNSA